MAGRTIQLFTTPYSSARVRSKADQLAAELRKGGATVLQAQDEEQPLAIAESADLVCAVGGDGTLRYVVDAVRKLDRPVTLGIFPAGTINLVARERNTPRNARDFARRLLSDAKTSPLHIALVKGLPLLACASVGPDSYAVERVSLRLKRLIGRAAYIVAFVHLLFRWPRAPLHVRHEGGAFDCEAVYVAKGRFYAGPWSFAPDAALNEASLHVVAMERATRGCFVRFMLQLLLRRPLGRLKGIRQFECTSLDIRSAIDAPVQSDGDVLYTLPVSITLSPTILDIV